MLPVIAYLWYKGKMTRAIAYLFLFVTAFFGFLIFAPMAPYQLQLAVAGDVQDLGISIFVVIGFSTLGMILTFVTGRIFCAQVCPIGAVQELIYTDPRYITSPAQKTIIMVIRFIYFVAFVVSGFLFSVALLRFFGIREFIYLDFNSTFFTVFVLLIAISLFFYRPLCRLSSRLRRQKVFSNSAGLTHVSIAGGAKRYVRQQKPGGMTQRWSAISAAGAPVSA